MTLFKHFKAGNVDNTIVLAECIDMMFFKRRKQIPSARLIAFIKRLSIVSLQMDSCSSAIVLDIIRKLISVSKNLRQQLTEFIKLILLFF